MKSIITTLKIEQCGSADQENKIKTTMIINYLFYLQIKPCVVDGWMDGWVGGWMDGWKGKPV